MRRKLRANKGVTLVEMLCCVLILILLGLMLHTGIVMAAKSYRKMIAESETQLLLSTIVDALADDLRYAREIVTEEEEDSETGGKRLVSYNSDSYGLAARLEIDEEGQIAAGGRKLLPAGVYANGAYKVQAMEIFYDGTCFIMDLEAGEKDGVISAKTRITVRCLNRKK